MARFGRSFPVPHHNLPIYDLISGPPTGTGSITLTGAAVITIPNTGTGSISLGGAGTGLVATGGGSITLGGAAIDTGGSGSITLSGSATVASEHETATATGSITLGGAATASAKVTATGSITLSGSATVASEHETATGTGHITLTAAATISSYFIPFNPAVPVAGNVTYYMFDLMTLQPITELPLQNVSFSQVLNDAGTFSADLNIRDPRVQNLNPLTGTKPGRTMVCIDIDGTLVWAGIIWTRRYTSSTGVLSLGGSELWSYFDYLLQANDYTNGPLGDTQPGFGFWPVASAYGMDTQMAAAAVVSDAITPLGNAWTDAGDYNTLVSMPSGEIWPTGPDAIGLQSLGIFIETEMTGGDVERNFWSFPSYPLSQQQSVSSIVEQLASAGYGSGFDFGVDVKWTDSRPGSTPLFQLTMSYPVRGNQAMNDDGECLTGLIIDLADDTDYEWDEDATSSMNNIYVTSSGAVTTSATVAVSAQAQDTAPLNAGYPLMEGTVSETQITTQAALLNAGFGALAQFEWPVAAPVVTLPMFSPYGVCPQIGSFIIGDLVRVVMSADDRFPSGFDVTMRIVGATYSIPVDGAPTMKLTLNMPITGISGDPVGWVSLPIAQAPL